MNLFSPHKNKFIKLTQSYHIAETAYEDGLSFHYTAPEVVAIPGNEYPVFVCTLMSDENNNYKEILNHA